MLGEVLRDIFSRRKPAGKTASFLPFYDREYGPRLGVRTHGFRAILGRVEEERTRRSAQERPLLVVETGSVRVPDNWEGDGQSTRVFDAFAGHQGRHGDKVLTVDIDPDAAVAVRSLCSDRVEAHTMDSVRFLHELSGRLGAQPIDLLYLDSFDLDVRNPHPSALHHLKELAAIWKNVGPGTVVAVDDNPVLDDGTPVGKGVYVAQFFRDLGIEPFYDGYQIAWAMR